MNDLKATSALQKLYKNSTREGQVSLVSTYDVTNPSAGVVVAPEAGAILGVNTPTFLGLHPPLFGGS